MLFELTGLPETNVLLKEGRQNMFRPIFQMQCGAGTVSVLDPVDDLVFTHGAKFAGLYAFGKEGAQPSWWRKAWTIRWLQAEHDFYAGTRGLRMTDALVRKRVGKPRSDVVWPRTGLAV